MRKITTLEALKQAEIKKMSFEDVFLSPQYKADLQGLVQTACRRVGYKGNVVLHTFFDEEKVPLPTARRYMSISERSWQSGCGTNLCSSTSLLSD